MINRIVNPGSAGSPFLTREQRESWKNDLFNQSDRGFAILAHAYLHEIMQKALSSIFIDTPEIDEMLFHGGNTPLGTSSSKRKLLYALGIIGSGPLHDITMLTKVRNFFAHHLLEDLMSDKPVSFDSPKVRNWCRELIIPRIFLIETQSGYSSVHFYPGSFEPNKRKLAEQIKSLGNRERYYWTIEILCDLIKTEEVEGGRMPTPRQKLNYNVDWKENGPKKSKEA